MSQYTPPEIMEASWKALLIHHKRKALFFVCAPVDLLAAANAIALDQTRIINAWLQSKHIFRPNDDEIQTIPNDKNFYFAIVQPYVLVQVKIQQQ